MKRDDWGDRAQRKQSDDMGYALVALVLIGVACVATGFWWFVPFLIVLGIFLVF